MKKNIIAKLLTLCFILLVIVVLIIILIIKTSNSNYHKKNSFIFDGYSDVLLFEKGKILIDGKKSMLELYDFKLNNNIDSQKIESLKVLIYINNKLWSDEEYNISKDKFINEFINEKLIFKEYPCPSYVDQNACVEGPIAAMDIKEFPNNLKVSYKICYADEECEENDLKINIKDGDR